MRARSIESVRPIDAGVHPGGDVRDVLEKIAAHPAPGTVRSLCVQESQHTTREREALLEAMRSMTSLVHLELVGLPLTLNQVSDLMFDPVVLDLSQTLPGDAGALALRQTPARHAQALYLQGCGLTNVGLRHLRACEEVITLDLGANPELATLPKHLELFDDFEWLETLSLCGSLDSEMLEHLGSYLLSGGLPSLRSLCVGGSYALPLPVLYGMIRVADSIDLELLQITCFGLSNADLDVLRERLTHDEVQVAVHVTHGTRTFHHNA